ncbi:hypothetical protein KA478_01975 [Patescibacteria group bacterium]|nr:hypothetical protein [Patescibacteria group bacterium]
MKLYQKLVFIAMITIFWVVLTLYTTYGIQTLFPHQALLATGYQWFCMALLVATCA